MNEFAIEWIKGDDCAGVTAPSGSALKSKLLRYAKERPGEVKIEALNQDGSVFLKIPVCWVKVSPPRKVSEKQREAMGERARKMWEEKRGLEG